VVVQKRLRGVVRGETGIIENATVLILMLGVVAGLLALRACTRRSPRWLGAWVALITACCFLFAGEELSWGQHLAGWSTPEGWGQVNDQQETNLHNVSGLLDQVPRGLLTLAALVGGTIVPVLVKAGVFRFNARRLAFWIWPTHVCIPACVLALVVTLPRKLAVATNVDVPGALVSSVGETKECLLATFMALYLWSLYRRLRRNEAESANVVPMSQPRGHGPAADSSEHERRRAA
jgi:hypothetical protein